VLVDTPSILDAEPAVRDTLRAHVVEILRSDPSIRLLLDKSEKTGVVRVRVEALPPRAAGAGGLWQLEVQLSSPEAAREFVGIADEQSGKAIVAILRAMFDQAWERLAAGRKLAEASREDLFAALKSQDPRIREAAVVEFGWRRDAAAVDALVAALRDAASAREMALALRIVGALTEIGDERAAEVFVELARGKDARFVSPLLFGLARLGGPTAEGYLLTVATGHPDPELQRAAKLALEELSARGKRPSTPKRAN
jgi:HEAT repeat protein